MEPDPLLMQIVFAVAVALSLWLTCIIMWSPLSLIIGLSVWFIDRNNKRFRLLVQANQEAGKGQRDV